ncbi:MAG: DEAD/DEAH box helicase [Planctomycetota bacterium]|nr:DEAD/DEAH box helicase [Planctomycetota bacterium]
MTKSRRKKSAVASLAARVQHNFDSAVRQRGQDYFESGAVELVRVAPAAVRAMVQGAHRYRTDLDWHSGTFTFSCGCPYFVSSGPCKHLWATVLAVDAEVIEFEHDPFAVLDAAERVASIGLEEDLDDYDGSPPLPPAPPPRPRYDPQRRGKATWKDHLDGLHQAWQEHSRERARPWPAQDELLYVIDTVASLRGAQLILEVCTRRRKKDGQWGPPKPFPLSAAQAVALPTPGDQRIAALLLGASEGYFYYGGRSGSSFGLNETLRNLILPEVCGTGRCWLRGDDRGQFERLTLDEGPPWQLRLDVRRDDLGDHYVLRGSLHRDGAQVDIARPVMLVPGGWVFWGEAVARLDDFGAFEWISLLRHQQELRVPIRQGSQLVEKLLQFPAHGRLDLPAELNYEAQVFAPQPCLIISRDEGTATGGPLKAELSFRYGELAVLEGADGSGVYEPARKRLILRDGAAEQAARDRLSDLRVVGRSFDPTRRLTPGRLPAVVRALVVDGWRVQAQGSLYRNPSHVRMSVASGIDWFELRGAADFGGASASIPELLTALRKGQNVVLLDDGSYGLLPEEWLERYGLLARIAEPDEDGQIRFTRAQAGLLDALLAEQDGAVFDEAFALARDRLREFESVRPAAAPPGFIGQLRAYQNEGLGWLEFLRQFGFGGCLADDMGLGKTVQVLALLEGRRELRAKGPGEGERPVGPSLAVVPRSVLFNWRQEAQRFCPALRVLEHCGAERTKDQAAHFAEYDLVLTTYGTLRRDITVLKDVAFDYVILDESQTIKNAGTGAAKAVRLLKASHRLCLSGTPIENHLGELWSQFEFLNPGMLGSSHALSSAAGADDERSRQLLARALRPFILRRTKSQVAKDLPDRTEQTIHCPLDTEQRRLYDELRDHYRRSLLPTIDRDGMGRSKIQILEALLRLRQAACHPGLIDPAKISEPSAKLDALLPQLQEVLDEGHKALVFSQFTSLLAIVRNRLDERKIVYEYLDGRTRDRQTHVERFQTDPACGLFRISLKAGGRGLNLTAAEYVFLLDPWWNPAVEAQAIDRAHRIGQTRHVFAYRLIASDTVEQHVLKLQQTKRALADAIINADNSLIRTLGREDLELLLT